MLASMPDDYPQGDMVTEALFRVALRKMVKQDWSGAMALLDGVRTFKVKETPSIVRRTGSLLPARARSWLPATWPARSWRCPT